MFGAIVGYQFSSASGTTMAPTYPYFYFKINRTVHDKSKYVII